MAFDPNAQDKNKIQDQGQGLPGNQPPTTSSAPGAGPGASGGKMAQTPQAAPSQPFQNLQSYLSANQPQIQSQADKTAGQLNNQYGQTTGNIDQAKTDYGSQVKAGYAAPNEDVVKQATTNPTEFAAKPENVKAFQDLYNDQYKGPDNFETSDVYGNLSGQVNKATSDANLVNTIPGLQTYYQSQNPNATKGGNILDSVLMQGSPEAYGTVTAAAKPFQGLQDYLSGTTTNVDKQIQDAKDLAASTSSGLQNKFIGESGIIPGFENELTNKWNQTKTDQGAASDKAIQDISTGTATPEELKLLGFDTSSGADSSLAQRASGYANSLKNDYGVNTDWNTLFTKQSPDTVYASPGSVATPEDIQKAQALGQLTGQDLSTYLGATAPTGPLVNANKAGLKGLGTNLDQRDMDTVQAAFKAIPGTDDLGVNPDNLIKWLNEDPARAQMLVDNQKFVAPGAGDVVHQLPNALARMGFKVTRTNIPPANPATKKPEIPGVFTPSNKPGLF